MNEKEKDLKTNEKVEEDKEKDYFYIIPKNVFEDRRLTPSQVMVFAEISQLSRKKGYCYASNTYLSEKMNMGRMTIIRAISKLKELRYIETENIYEENSQEVKLRKILLDSGTKMKQGGTKTIQGVVSKCNKGGIKMEPVRNISNKNINNKNNIYSRVGNEFEKRQVKENENKDIDINKNINDLGDEKQEKDNFVADVISYLNNKAGKNFRASSQKTKRLIKARRNEKYNLDDFKKVIDVKTGQWKNNPQMNKFLRPETLFSNKFESYLQEYTPLAGSERTEESKRKLFEMLEERMSNARNN
ncbi:conserved phage C-terminal domain-containing protein [Anaerococcus prevotii]|uniref:Conserved domain protein n=1 Tax=Anaerococcus prevotii ACS-065-V-Col13 TaxID=879305 RepID=F0GU38_9FIRM|nr:conserved phage C-terminal domain-containing protein [Anaerococcus prevotii]EGC82548.1 conserved domain protein [Anaerococcus prevotii ACS-065-V-Col13]